MKKRLFALVLAAVLLLTAVPVAKADPAVLCFVAMNDTIPLTLSGGEMPYYSKSSLYIPYTAFNISPNGVGATYNAEKNTFVLFNKDETLIFDLKEDVYVDSHDNEYDVNVVFRGGMLYVPSDVLRHFGLYTTLLSSRAGYSIIRFTNGGEVYDDGMFVAQAENLIARAASEYAASVEQKPEVPVERPDEPDQEPEEETGPVNVYPAFVGNAVAESTLRVLKDLQLRSAFFLTEAQILENRELVRAIYAAGHTIGLTVEPEETDPEAALKRANDALDTVLFCKALFVLLPETMEVEADGWNVLREPVDVTLETILATPQATHLYVIREDAPPILTLLADRGTVLLRLKETTF